MLTWLRRLLHTPPATVVATPTLLRPTPAPVAASGGARPSVLHRLLDEPPPRPGACTVPEHAALEVLDEMLAREELPADLVPRAPAVVPQLLRLLRQDRPSRSAIVQQVGKDVALAAEVLRMASSPMYRTRNQADSLDGAVAMLGTEGLRMAVARTVLRPVFNASGEGTAGRAAQRIWEHAERHADTCAAISAQEGCGRFEACLAALLHAAGWTAVLRTLDRAGIAPDGPWSTAFDEALADRRDRLFARIAIDWQMTPAVTALGEDILRHGLADAKGPLARVLRRAEHECPAAPAVEPVALAA